MKSKLCVSRMLMVLLVTVSLNVSGCSSGNTMPRTEPVSGVVTIQGKAIEGVEVYFTCDQFVSYGKTDSQGHYSLVQGAVSGENKVYFKKTVGGDAAFAQQEGVDDYMLQMAAESSGGGKKTGATKPIVPAEFADPANPKLSFLVAPGGTDAANFKL
jgi:hypothetical protein